jgi:RNA polymerase sigma-70 factor (ECF subfamily)
VATGDTVMGGPGREFPATIWSDVLAAGDPENARHRERLEQLMRAYWKPVYGYIRTAWRRSVEDSKDLTQAFFAHVLQKGFLARARAERGSFRGYLKQALKNFRIDAERSAAARRPERPVFPLEPGTDDAEGMVPPTPGETAEQVYDRQWFRCLLDASIEDLRASLDRNGRAAYYEVLRAYLIDPIVSGHTGAGGSSVPTYAEVAGRLGLRESDVLNYLAHCRRELRRLLRERIRAYVGGEGEVDAELGRFMGS